MNLSEFFIKKPVFCLVATLLLILIGYLSLINLPLRQYPDIEKSQITIDTRYPGSASSIVETKITEIIENQISGIEGIRSIDSVSRDGRSKVNIEFNQDKNILVIACPGSGKTRTLISRLCYLIDCGADPKSCLAFTFTRDATNEIKERTEHILGEVAANKITIKNFHSFALQILLRHGKEYDILGRGGSTSGGLTVIDEKEQYQYVANAVARIMEYEGFKKGNISSLIPKEAMDCGKGLSDDDDSGKANGLEEYLQRDLKLWDSDGWGATTISKNMRRVGFDYPLTGPGAPNPDHVTHFLKVIKLSKAQPTVLTFFKPFPSRTSKTIIKFRHSSRITKWS